jgi:hypothetical protein
VASGVIRPKSDNTQYVKLRKSLYLASTIIIEKRAKSRFPKADKALPPLLVNFRLRFS